ncbi:MAG: prepilin-type N-terminal cleavage/methylation domain-containing protein [Candidatus Omnitrophica bacterium]|nr:prepilin-type N-terminal cleavage/methylation domain-containing protein [Candidatus Omnitrophota bacterium]MDE2009297.1 prepilin-type N-terminal cleavage/methylation domain-containing protein [Candidatus Omnitrophota bacterium]MDE2232326.1 prepilin-type N-terminal cleavage/methylation domain-containing protein [Candidatus Omnitrophota bacterium]
MNNKAFTLLELLMAVGVSVLLLTGVYGFFIVSNQTYSAGVSGENLQDAANTILGRITEGDTESGNIYRLSTGVSFMVPNGVGTALYTCGGLAQTTPCNATYPYSEIYYCQDSPCTPTDSTARWYYLNGAGTSIMYHYPGEPNNQDITLYTAPSGSTLSLLFSPAQVGNPAQASTKVVEINVDLTQNVSNSITNSRLKASGDALTYVLMRNHP